VKKLSRRLLSAACFLAIACTPESAKKPSSSARETLRVLTYSSFLGEGSYGEWLKREFESQHPHLEVVYVEAQDGAGLAGELKRRRGDATGRIDLAVGLDEVTVGRVGREHFARLATISSSPMTILVHRKRASAALAARKFRFATWRELVDSKLLEKSLVVQDPRFSAPGLSWLLQTHALAGVTPNAAQGLVRRVFPSWSSTFAAFDGGEGTAVWTYSSSLSYYECDGKPHELVALRVDEGYLSSDEIAAVVQGAVPATEVLLNFLLSGPAQQKLSELNWVYPVGAVTLPKCFVPRESFPRLPKAASPSATTVNQWIDEWQLL
jgi:thiamine transport system substrate-binding protein